MFNWKLWAKGLLAAVIAGATAGAIDAVSNGDLRGASRTAGASALVGGLLYLKTHPPVTDTP